MARAERVLKVVVLGEAGVGKTSLIDRFVNNFYTDCQQTSINLDIHKKQVTVDGRQVTLEIWDTAGCERFHSISVGFYRGAVCCILVYDVTNPRSFRMLETWRDNFILVAGARQQDAYSFVVIGNKIDIPCRSVPSQRAEHWCSTHGNLPYFETSARDSVNVDLAFQAVAQRALGLPQTTDPSIRLALQTRDENAVPVGTPTAAGSVNKRSTGSCCS